MLLEALFEIRQISRWPKLGELQQLSRRIRDVRSKMSAAELEGFDHSPLSSGHEYKSVRDYIYGASE